MSRPLRILIDARMLIGRFSGVARMVTKLVDGLARRDDCKVMALCGREPFEPWSRRDDIKLISTGFNRRDRTPIRRLWWEETKLSNVIRRSGADVFHATWNSGVPPFCRIPSVLTIHDLIPWDAATNSLTARWQRSCYRRAVNASAKRAKLITTVSQYVAGVVAAKFSVSRDRVVTIYNGVDTPSLSIDSGSGKKNAPFVLYVGGHEERKNVAGLFKAMTEYWKRLDPSLELHLTGDANSLAPNASDIFHKLPPSAPVRFLGTPSDAALADEYSGASALLMLSRDEGFGLPVLEAMAHGCPVLAANRSALPEVVGNAGVLVDPADSKAIAEELDRVLKSPEHGSDLIDNGRRRAQEFSWERTIELLLDSYRRAIGMTRRSAQFSNNALAEPPDPSPACVLGL